MDSETFAETKQSMSVKEGHTHTHTQLGYKELHHLPPGTSRDYGLGVESSSLVSHPSAICS